MFQVENPAEANTLTEEGAWCTQGTEAVSVTDTVSPLVPSMKLAPNMRLQDAFINIYAFVGERGQSGGFKWAL